MDDATAWTLVGQHLDPTSIARVSRTCKFLRKIFRESDEVWLAAFESVFGASATIPGSWVEETSTWFERFKRVFEEIPRMFSNPPRPSVWTFGQWQIVVVAPSIPSELLPHDLEDAKQSAVSLDARTFFLHEDGKSGVEIPWGSVGWVYVKIDGAEYTQWMQGDRSPNSHSDTRHSFLTHALETCKGKSLPLFQGARATWQSELSEGDQWKIEFLKDRIIVVGPGSDDDCGKVVIMRDSSEVLYRGKPVAMSPIGGQE